MTDLSIDLPVQLVPQPSDVSCWAASLAMVAGYRDSSSYMPEDVAAKAGMDANTSYGWPEIQAAVSAWGLVEAGPASAMPEEWANNLQASGPLWIVEVGAPYHAVVVGGIRGDGTPEATEVKIYNPWPPGQGAIDYLPFLDFDQDFGLGAGADAQIVHG